MSAIPRFSYLLSDTIQDKLWQWVQANYGLQGSWLTLWLNDLPLGCLNAQWQAQIQKDWQGKWALHSDGLHLYANNWLSLSEALQHMAYDWKKLGILHGWRNELFDVCYNDKILFPLERTAFRPLGLMSKAVHLNGFTLKDGEWQLWIGRRSEHKTVDPDKLDNLVGGGVSCGEDIITTMLRESEEEAGLSPHHLQHLSLQNQLHSLRPVSRGLHNETLYIFDTVLSNDVIPDNQDGEVAGFELMNINQVIEAMLSDVMMSDAQLAILDAFDRYGLIDPQHDLSKWLKSIKTNG